METASIEQVSLHGHAVSYRIAGPADKPAVLLIHGIAGSSRTWEPLIELLGRDHRVIAPDLPGHGESDPPAGDYSIGAYAAGLRDLLAVLGIPRATLVGHSLGGGIAMQLAYQHPECCERMVLVDSGGLGTEVTWLLRLITLPGAELVAPVFFPPFVRGWGDALGRLAGSLGLRSPRISEGWRSYSSLIDGPTRRSFVKTVHGVIETGGQAVSAIDRLYLLENVPTLILWGDRDGIIPISHGRAAHEAVPGSAFEVIEGCGHFPHAEEPARVSTVLRQFIASTEPAQLSVAQMVDAVRQAGQLPA
jgi:pimeloyl-ACP methyl ester carboxylesterase